MLPAAARLLACLFESSAHCVHGCMLVRPQHHAAAWHVAQVSSSILRPVSSGAARADDHGVLSPFLAQHALTPAVEWAEGLEDAPTALSWLRRRGPRVHHGALFRAFRQRQVRLFDGQRVVRVRQSRVLAPGDVLLFPRQLLAGQRALPAGGWCDPQHAGVPPLSPNSRGGGRFGGQKHFDNSSSTGSQGSSTPADEERVCSHDEASGSGRTAHNKILTHRGSSSSIVHPSSADSGVSRTPPLPPGLLPLSKAPGLVDPHTITPALLRSWVLDATRDVIFLNKPAGVPVQGRNSLDSHMRTGLRLDARDEPRLVHRLDRNVSGVMAIARSASAAAWLSAALRRKVGEATGGGSEGGRSEGEDGEGKLGVRRVYWALLAGTLPVRREGRIRYPLLVNGSFKPAVTYYRVRASHPAGLSWVELEPVTGRRHQLRVHCAQVLGAPIVGDVKYGYRGVAPHKALARALPAGWWEAYSPQTAGTAAATTDRRERRRAAARAAEAAAAARSRLRAQPMAGSDDEDVEQDTRGGRALSSSSAQDTGDSSQGQTAVSAPLRLVGDEAVGEDDTVEERRRDEEDEVGQEQGGRGSSSMDSSGKVGEVEHVFPLFLHARKLTVRHSAREAPVRVRAPMPSYMWDVVAAMRWPLPQDRQ